MSTRARVHTQTIAAVLLLSLFSVFFAGTLWAIPEQLSETDEQAAARAMAKAGAGKEPFQVQVWRGEWTQTDFTRHSVDFSEIVSGGPPRDGIPPIDQPRFVDVTQAAEWITPGEPLLVYRQGGDVRGYPLQILIFHEIVNDVVGGAPVVITFCPLCNAALVFSRRVGGKVLTFGTTGKLRHSDLIMWDRQTHSWWQQLDGAGIVGHYTGAQLQFLPAQLLSFKSFREYFPKARVLSRETGHQRNYGRNPYAGYDNLGTVQPFLFSGEVDKRLPAMTRVVSVEREGAVRAYPFPELRMRHVINDRLGGKPLVIFWAAGARSMLDARELSKGREVGSVGVYQAELDGQPLRFQQTDDAAVYVDQLGNRWDFLGRAMSGSARGRSLMPLVHGQHFAFAWFAFKPGSEIWRE